MKRIMSVITVFALVLASMFLFSAENQPGSERPTLNEFGETHEIAHASEIYAFYPKNYTVVYLRPAGEGLLGEISIFTHRPKMLLYRGALTEEGIKFTSLFPAVHFIYVTNSYTGSKLSLTYRPAGGSENMSQDDRVKLAFEFAEANDKEFYERLKQIRERSRTREQERERTFRGQQQPTQPQQ